MGKRRSNEIFTAWYAQSVSTVRRTGREVEVRPGLILAVPEVTDRDAQQVVMPSNGDACKNYRIGEMLFLAR